MEYTHKHCPNCDAQLTDDELKDGLCYDCQTELPTGFGKEPEPDQGGIASQTPGV